MEQFVDEQRIWLNENNFISKDYRIIDSMETRELRKKWRVIFIPNVKNREILHKCQACSKEDMRSYDWHAFSYKEIEAKEVKGDFLKEEIACDNKPLYLLWEECVAPGLIMDSNIIKNGKWTNTDIYIFDSTFTWTFIVTHEGWFYFLEIR